MNTTPDLDRQCAGASANVNGVPARHGPGRAGHGSDAYSRLCPDAVASDSIGASDRLM